MSKPFANKVALVTGAGSGIGRASAIRFAQEGAQVVAVDVQSAGIEETCRMIRDLGGEACPAEADISKADQVQALITKVRDVYGRLDYAHNNAGIAGAFRGPLHEYSEDEWDRVVDINLKGVWLCMKYEVPEMLRNGGGAIVNTSSIMGVVSIQGNSAYGASKHGVVGLTKTAALDYAQKGIRVNAVCPGYIETTMTASGTAEKNAQYIAKTPLGRFGKPQEIAAAVVWLCSNEASFVTGHALAVDGGYLVQ